MLATASYLHILKLCVHPPICFRSMISLCFYYVLPLPVLVGCALVGHIMTSVMRVTSVLDTCQSNKQHRRYNIDKIQGHELMCGESRLHVTGKNIGFAHKAWPFFSIWGQRRKR